MTMPTQVAPDDINPKMPVPFEDENTECLCYILGHLSDRDAAVAVALWQLSEGLHDRDEAYGCVAEATIERVYYRDDPDDEGGDRMLLCAADDVGAQPFTRIAGRMTLTATQPCGCVIAVRLEGMRVEGDVELVQTAAMALAWADAVPHSVHMDGREWREGGFRWTHCTVCGGAIYEHYEWSHAGGTSPLDHAACPDEDLRVVAPA